MRKALVTLTIGDKYINNFDKYCHSSWSKYARRYGLDLIVITNPIDDSVRAQSRSPAWQKCLILSHADVARYDQVAWIDSDILINTASPDVFESVPLEMIGAVDDYATPNSEDHNIFLKRLYEYWDRKNIKYINNLTAVDYHKNYGLTIETKSVVQTGVLVLSPKYHRELLERVYYNYEEKGSAYWNYEMRPLSYEILKEAVAFWLNPKFNMNWPIIKQNYYPFLNNNENKSNMLNRIASKSGLSNSDKLMMKCATTTFLNNYFLHFAGSSSEMRYVDQNVNDIFELD